MTAGPPCRCSSATSSPVKECGAGNHSTSASSIGSSSLPISRRSVATRGFGRARAVSAASAARASAPEMRTTATPDRPGGVANA